MSLMYTLRVAQDSKWLSEHYAEEYMNEPCILHLLLLVIWIFSIFLHSNQK